MMENRLLFIIAIPPLLLTSACGTKIQEDYMKQIAGDDFIQALLTPQPMQNKSESMKLFGQFVGSWDWAGHDYADDGSKTPTKGRWIFQSVLNGMAIQDVFIFGAPHGNKNQCRMQNMERRCGFPIAMVNPGKPYGSVR